VCNYHTNKLYDYNRHKTTKKHNKNIQIYNNNKNKTKRALTTISSSSSDSDDNNHSYSCDVCSKTFKYKYNLYKHQRHSCKTTHSNTAIINYSESSTDNSILLKLIQKLEEQINDLRKDKETTVKHIEKLTDAHIISQKVSHNALKFAQLHFSQAPPIKKINYDDTIQFISYDKKIQDDDFKLELKLLDEFKKNSLHKFIGNIIIEHYKKENTSDQSLWSTDITRLSFIIKEIVQGNDKWISDKKGDKIKKYIIEPLLEKIKDMIFNYVNTQNPKIKFMDNVSQMELTSSLINESLNLIFYINSCKLENDIMKHIAPKFYLEK